MSQSRLKITEIFYSLQGEARDVGWPTVFIRLTGCPLRCDYCDTEYAFTGGSWVEIDQILSAVKNYKTSHVTVTGGEPLAQKNCIELLTRLCDEEYQVSLETSGALPVDDVDERVVKVIDIKTPGSNEDSKNRFENLALLDSKDQLKFVICDENDYHWSKSFIKEHSLIEKCEILFSPVYGSMEASDLAGWILRDQLDVRFQIQLHKHLWGDKAGV